MGVEGLGNKNSLGGLEENVQVKVASWYGLSQSSSFQFSYASKVRVATTYKSKLSNSTNLESQVLSIWRCSRGKTRKQLILCLA